MQLILAYALENFSSVAGRFKWPQILQGVTFQMFLCAFSLISGGVLQASDPGQLVWKEQRGMMRSAEIGVVVWKEQPFHSDASSKAFAFSSMRKDGPITWFFNGAANKSFEKHELFQQIRFPQWPLGEIVEELEFESLKFKLGELEAFAQKYPNAAVLLNGIAGSMRDAVSEFSSGKVYFSGNWITREEYEKLADQRNEMLKKYKLEREELERSLLKEGVGKRKSEMAVSVQHWSTLILVAVGVWLLILLLALLTKSWASVSFLVVSLAAVAGWFTFTESGFGWTEYVVLAVKDLPALLPFSKQ
ncbi:MAG: hypothetical protein NTU84_05535 [Verrucomicrobia bacterium]|jgi:hypothetical protein|nr:hypothetical protein [Verrucomicrobiota bacterium]